MKSLALPALVALIFHGIFLYADLNPEDKGPVVKPAIRFMTMSLSVKQSVVEKIKKVVKPKKKKKTPPEKSEKKKPVKKKEPDIKAPVAIAKAPPEPEVSKPDETETKIEPIEEKNDVAEGATAKIREALPLYDFNPSPSYPRTARLRSWEGVVKLDVLVDKDGKVKDVNVEKSSGYSLLDRSALKSVRHWRFQPGLKGDKKIEMRVIVPVRFKLDSA